MPIRSDDFERNERASSTLFVDFLRVNYRDASKLDELVGSMELMGKSMTTEEVEALFHPYKLALLSKKGQFETKGNADLNKHE